MEIVERRPGDVAACYADPTLAERLLGWKATRDLGVMCADSWRWQRLNPRGYRDPNPSDTPTGRTDANIAKQPGISPGRP